MKQTDQYGLNQWDLSDRIRMEDFNADNFKIAAALAGLDARADGLGSQIATLDGQVSGLGQQLSTLGGTVAGLPTSASLEKLKMTLQDADAKLQETKLGTETIRFIGDKGFHATADKKYFSLDSSSVKFNDYLILFMQFSMSYSDDEIFYLQPTSRGTLLPCGCISTEGVLDKGIAKFIHSRNVCLAFFPVKGLARQLNCLFFSQTAGLGYCIYNFIQVDGFAIVPASGKAVIDRFQYDATFLGIK
ncbi:hypothetical protein [uncultured Oscillibacter sp.]|uniref:hypothetical protein n=1 Tax=uncultured Oscillibacter sp. TaxID=876091 RepID=UPI002631F992|nr:hypothetical protein [uncultured Oscillibacter sp.]